MSSPTPLSTAPVVAATRWQLRLLGRFLLDDGHRALGPLRSRSAMLLLARLALAPERDHAREELAALLWPDADGVTGRNRLRQTLSLLKAVLEPPGAPPVLLADRRVLRVVPGALWCDVPAFEQACWAGQRALAGQLYRGLLLPGLADEWIVDERQRLAALHQRLGDAAPAPPVVVPRPPPPAPTVPPLPGYLTPLVGADTSGARLQALLAQHRLVTVLGAGGVGKTRLAVEVARCLCSPGPAAPPQVARVALVPLVGVVHAADLRPRLLAHLHEQTHAQPYAQPPASGPLLLVLDHCEQLDEGAVQVLAQCIEEQPGVQWLLTARRPLGLDGERCFQLQPLPLPTPCTPVAELALNPALALFIHRARAHRPDFHLQRLPPDQQAALIDLVAWLEGLPLALELAALQMRTLDPAALLALLRAARDDRSAPGAGLRFLARRGVRGGSDPRHVSMWAVLAGSWQLLDAAQQALLTRLCQRPGATPWAQAVALGSDGPAAAQARLHTLVSHAVLTLQRGPAEPLHAQAQAKAEVQVLPPGPVREFVLAVHQDPGLLADLPAAP
jgi:predicted ATPase